MVKCAQSSYACKSMSYKKRKTSTHAAAASRTAVPICTLRLCTSARNAACRERVAAAACGVAGEARLLPCGVATADESADESADAGEKAVAPQAPLLDSSARQAAMIFRRLTTAEEGASAQAQLNPLMSS